MNHLPRPGVRRVLTWLCWVLLLSQGWCLPEVSAVEKMHWEALFAGDVLVHTVHRPDGLSGLRAWFTVEAPRERIWTVLLDYDNFTKIFEGVKQLKVLESNAQEARVEYWIDAVFSTYHYVVSRQYAEPGRRLTWTRLAGDLKRLEGSWEIRETPRAGFHMLVYEFYVEVGGIVPESVVRLEAIRHTKAMGERLRLWIENRPVPETRPFDTNSAQVPRPGD